MSTVFDVERMQEKQKKVKLCSQEMKQSFPDHAKGKNDALHLS